MARRVLDARPLRASLVGATTQTTRSAASFGRGALGGGPEVPAVRRAGEVGGSAFAGAAAPLPVPLEA